MQKKFVLESSTKKPNGAVYTKFETRHTSILEKTALYVKFIIEGRACGISSKQHPTTCNLGRNTSRRSCCINVTTPVTFAAGFAPAQHYNSVELKPENNRFYYQKKLVSIFISSWMSNLHRIRIFNLISLHQRPYIHHSGFFALSSLDGGCSACTGVQAFSLRPLPFGASLRVSTNQAPHFVQYIHTRTTRYQRSHVVRRLLTGRPYFNLIARPHTFIRSGSQRIIFVSIVLS